MPVRTALLNIPGQRTHGWQDTDAASIAIIGVVEITTGDGEQVAAALEAAGILVLPDHRLSGPVGKPVIDALSAYGVNASDTTASAMAKVQAKSLFPPHKAKRFS